MEKLSFIEKVRKFQHLKEKNPILFFKKVVGVEKKKPYSWKMVKKRNSLIKKFNKKFNANFFIKWKPCSPTSYERGEIKNEFSYVSRCNYEKVNSKTKEQMIYENMLNNCSWDLTLVKTTYGENWVEILSKYVKTE